MDAHGNTNWFKKPNRRLSTQRRVNSLDRRQNDLAVSFCSRATKLSRRRNGRDGRDERRVSMHATDWIQLNNTLPRKQIYICANDSPRIGQFVDLAV